MTDIADARWARAPVVTWRRTFDEILVHGESEVVSLSGAARVLWELLDEPTTASSLVADLAALHGVRTASIASEFERTLDELRRGGLLVTGEGASTTSPVARRSIGGRMIRDDPAAALAAWGLGAWDELPDLDLSGWEAAVTAIQRERLSGLVFGACTAGELALDSDRRAEIASLHRGAMVVAVQLERLLIDTVAALAASGIDAIVLKGPSLAHTSYDDPAHRPFGDIDLLVRPDDIDGAFAALIGLGHERRYAEPRPGFDRRFGKGAAFVTDTGLEIDVHRTFASGPFGLTVDLDEARRDPGHIVVAGRDVAVLAPPQQLVAVAMHAALGTRWPRLLNLRDVVQLLARHDVDTDAAVEVAMRWRVDAALSRAVRLAAETFHLDDDVPLVTWSREHATTRAQLHALEAYTAPTRGYARQAVSALRVIPGVRLRATYVRAMLLPDRGYREDRESSVWRRWRRVLRTAVLDR